MTTINVESKQHQYVGNAAFMWLRSLSYRCPSLFKSYEIINAVMGAPFNGMQVEELAFSIDCGRPAIEQQSVESANKSV